MNHTLLACAFGASLLVDRPSLLLLGLCLICSGLFFNALQPIVHRMLGDLAAEEHRGSPVRPVQPRRRDRNGGEPGGQRCPAGRHRQLGPGAFTAAGVMAVSVVLYSLVRERIPGATA